MTTTYEYSRMALEVYYDDPQDVTVDLAVFTKGGTSTDGSLVFTPAVSEFFGAYYKDTAGNIVIAYRGTDSLPELVSNASWGTVWPNDGPPLQVLDAYNFYLAVLAKEGPSANISFTGHSLGGGLAGTIAAMIGAEAKLFAPAPFEGTALQIEEDGGAVFPGPPPAPSIPAPNGGVLDSSRIESYRVDEEIVGELYGDVNEGFGSGSVLGSLFEWSTDYSVDSEYASTSFDYFVLSAGLHGMALHAFAAYVDASVVPAGTSAFDELSDSLPRLLPQLVNHDIAKNVWNGELNPRNDTPKVSTYFLETILSNPIVLSDFSADLQLLADVLMGSSASDDPEFNTAIIQLVIEHAARRVEDSSAVSEPLLSVESGVLSITADVSAFLGTQLIQHYMAEGIPEKIGLETGWLDGWLGNHAYAVAAETFFGSVDRIQIEANGSSPVTIEDATAQGGDVINDLMIGGASVDLLKGGLGNDYLYGADGHDVLDGGAGDNILDGGDGLDTVGYSAAATGVEFEVGGGTSDENDANLIKVTDNGQGGADLLASIERLYGSDHADTLVLKNASVEGLDRMEFIDLGDQGVGERDKVDASALTGGIQADWSDANNQTILSKDTDGLLVVKNAETLIATSFDDEIKLGGSSHNVVDAGAGNDIIDVNNAVGATIFGGAGDDIAGNLGDGSVFHGGEGVDTLVVGSDNVLFADADGGDQVVFGTQVLTGAYSMSTSEREIVDDRFGLVSYGKNDSGELVLISSANGANTFVANYDEGVQTAGITIGQIIFNAYRLIDEDFPGMQVMFEGMEAALDLISQVVKGVPWQGINDPLVFDLDGDGIELLGQSGASPLFDIDGDGFAERTGWVNGNDGFLVVDANANGLVDDVTEMFGSATESGFTELTTYDTNLDGVVDAADTDFGDLKIWRDANGDGVTDTGELVSLADLDITSISLTTSTVGAGMVGTNEITATGTFSYSDGSTGTLGDVNFDADQFNSSYQGDTSVSAAAVVEANLKGHGILTDLHVAMTQDAALLALVSSTVPGMTSNSLEDLRLDARPILEAWGATAAGAGPVPHDVPMLTHLDANGKTVVDDFGVYDSATDSWGWASGADVLDAGGLPIALPTYAQLLAQDPGSNSWYTFTGESIAFLEAYFGEPIFLLDEATNTGSAVVAAAETYLEKMVEIMDLAAVRLAMQGGLSSYFPNIDYDVDRENFVATDDRQLISTYEQILTNLPTDAADHDAYISNWAGIMNVVVGDFDRGGSHLQNTYNFIFANLVAAHESVQPAMALIDIAEGFGIPSGLIVTGAGTMAGTVENDIFYMDSSDQTAEGGVGFDVYVFGKDFGADIINDVELATEAHSNDLIRFADYASTDFTATRDGLDLILTVTGTTNSVRVVNQFTIVEPGLFGGTLTDDNGIAEISFADGVVWGSRDIAKAVADRRATGDTIMGTQELDYLDGGAGDDYLEGGDSADIYVFGRGYGADTVEDNQDNILLKGDDAVLFGDQVTLDDIEFNRVGGSEDVTIGIKGSADSLTIKNQFDAFNTGPFGVVWLDRVEMFFFSDGTMISWQDVMDYTMSGSISDGDDFVYGFYRNDYIDAGAGDDFMSGGNHADTYVFDRGYGQDTIQEFSDAHIDVTTLAEGDRVVFGEGIVADDLVFERDGNSKDLKISIKNDDATLTINDQFQSYYTAFGQMWFHLIEEFEFSDGTTLNWQEVLLSVLADQQTDGDDFIYGFDLEDTLDGGAGNDYLSGGNENDTYIFGLDYGVDTIRDGIPNVLGGLDDNVTFNSDIATSMILLSRDDDRLVISIDGTADQLIIEKQFSYGSLGYGSYEEIEEFRFSDGTIWTDHDVRVKLLEGTIGNDTLLGFFSDDVLDGGLGDDRLEGGDGADTYKFDIGYGQDVIYDHMRIISYEYQQDVVQFGAGVTVADTEITRVGDDLVLSFAGATDTLTIEDQFKIFTSGNYWDSVETFQFADGTTWTISDIFAALLTSTSGDDTLVGSADADTLDGGAGNDLLQGDMGDDTYVFGVGYGNDIVHEHRSTSYDSPADRVLFDATVAIADVTLSQIGSDLLFTLTSGETLTVKDQFGQWYNRVEKFEFDDGTVWNTADIQAILDGTAIGAPTIVGTAAGETLNGGGDVDIIDAKEGDDTINAQGGDDVLIGGLGNDTLNGGNGNDLFVYNSGDGNDLIDEFGGAGDTDTLRLVGLNAADVTFSRSYGATTRDLFITINATGETISIDDQFNSSHYGLEEVQFADGTIWDRDTIMSEAWIRGTDMADSITGSADADTINGGLGDDTLDGNSGNDLLLGGQGDDVLIGNIGDDFLDGGAGNDSLVGDTGNDTLDGGLGVDTLNGKSGNDTFIFRAGDGNDLIDEYGTGASDVDTLKLEGLNSVDVSLSRGAGANSADLYVTIIATGEVITIDDHFNGNFTGIEQIEFADGTVWDRAQILANSWMRGTDGDDLIEGSIASDVLFGGLGDDTLKGKGGSDTYVYRSGDGNDLIDEYGTAAGDVDTLQLQGLNVADVTFSRGLVGNTNDVFIDVHATGERITIDDQLGSTWTSVEQIEFADGTVWDKTQIRDQAWMRGTDGDDTISGTSGADIMFGGLGDDTLNGSYGNDIFYGDVGSDILNGGYGDDLFYGGAGADVHNGGYGTDTVSYSLSSTAIYLHLGDLAQSEGDAVGDTFSSIERIEGTDFNDEIIADSASNTIIGGLGDDIISGLNGNDTLLGGDGSDTLYGNAGNDHIEGGAGNDTVFGYEDNDTLLLGDGDDYAIGGSGDDVIEGEAGDDELHGHDGADTLNGGAGDDFLYADAGDDVIVAGSGDDFMLGGAGSDTFVFTAGLDGNTIGDFEAGVGNDVVRLEGLGISDFAGLQSYMSEWNGNTYIDVDNDNWVTLEGVTMSELDTANFQFA